MNIDWLISLITPKEWIAIVWILIAVFAAVETFKRILMKFSRQRRKEYIYYFALVAGFVSALFLWPSVSDVPWFIIGIIAGPGANFLHKGLLILVEWKTPGLAAIIKGKKLTPK